MSDEKLRELERRFKETGSVEDEAAWLKALHSAGRLSQEQIDLAAATGYEATRSLATPGSFVVPDPYAVHWVSREVAVRAGLAMVEAFEPWYDEQAPKALSLAPVLVVVREWCVDPSTAGEAKAAHQARALDAAVSRHHELSPLRDSVCKIAQAAVSLGEGVADEDWEHLIDDCYESAACSYQLEDPLPEDLVRWVAQRAGSSLDDSVVVPELFREFVLKAATVAIGRWRLGL